MSYNSFDLQVIVAVAVQALHVALISHRLITKHLCGMRFVSVHLCLLHWVNLLGLDLVVEALDRVLHVLVHLGHLVHEEGGQLLVPDIRRLGRLDFLFDVLEQLVDFVGPVFR